MQSILFGLFAGFLLAAPSALPEPALVAAARQGAIAEVRALVGRGVDVNAKDDKGRSALVVAVAQGHLEVARVLIEAGADVDAATPSGWTALMEAASRGNARAAILLLDAGANPDARHRFAGTALDVAQQANHMEIVRLLRDRGSRGSGRSEGDTVCSRRWSGQGFCGVVRKVEPTRYRVRVTRLEGCGQGCAPNEDCSEGRVVGGRDGIGIGDELWIRSWCITDTQVPPR
jgi:Ankyrin repeats (3 copies)/Ankyrin repeat